MPGITEFRRLAGVPEPLQERGPRFESTELEEFLNYVLKKLPAFIERGKEVLMLRTQDAPKDYITRVTGYMVEGLEKAQEHLHGVQVEGDTGGWWLDKKK